MTVSRLWVERCRSLVDLHIVLHPLTVIQGENATGKTNLYRAVCPVGRRATVPRPQAGSGANAVRRGGRRRDGGATTIDV